MDERQEVFFVRFDIIIRLGYALTHIRSGCAQTHIRFGCALAQRPAEETFRNKKLQTIKLQLC